MGRFGRFNPRQKRDRKGRWSKGGGSGGGKKGSGTLPLKSGKRPSAAKVRANKERNRAVRRGAVIGAGIGSLGIIGTLPGAAIGAGIALRKHNKAKRKKKG